MHCMLNNNHRAHYIEGMAGSHEAGAPNEGNIDVVVVAANWEARLHQLQGTVVPADVRHAAISSPSLVDRRTLHTKHQAGAGHPTAAGAGRACPTC